MVVAARLISVAILILLLGYAHVMAFAPGGWLSFTFAEFVVLMFLTEATLLAGWWGLSRHGALFRFLFALLGAWFMWLTAFRVATRLPLFSSPSTAISAATWALLAQGIGTGSWFLIFRWWGLRVEWSAGLFGGRPSRPRQFHLRHLFVFTALTAALLALTRHSWPRAGWGMPPADRASLQIVGLFAAFGGILNPPVAVAIARPSLRAWWLFPYLVFISIAQSAVLGVMYDEFHAETTLREAAFVLGENVMWNVVQLLPLLASMLLLRFAGMRLVVETSEARAHPSEPAGKLEPAANPARSLAAPAQPPSDPPGPTAR